MIFPEDKNLARALEFTVEMDKMKSIFRRSSIFDGSRRENDAEHSFHIAVMALAFEKYAPEGVNLLRVLKMLLVHDIVEIDAGGVGKEAILKRMAPIEKGIPALWPTILDLIEENVENGYVID